MNEIARGYWANAICNSDFICIETYSGYRGGTNRDPKGRQYFLNSDANEEALGLAIRNALSHSRFVLAAPRSDITYSSEVEFDMELYDSKLGVERYVAWTKALMERYNYKTKQALFKDMKCCNIINQSGLLTIRPTHHKALEAWTRTKDDGIEDIIIPSENSLIEIGAGLRTAFSRCTK